MNPAKRDRIVTVQGGATLTVAELALRMSMATAHTEANRFEPCNNPQCTLCYPFTIKGN